MKVQVKLIFFWTPKIPQQSTTQGIQTSDISATILKHFETRRHSRHMEIYGDCGLDGAGGGKEGRGPSYILDQRCRG